MSFAYNSDIKACVAKKINDAACVINLSKNCMPNCSNQILMRGVYYSIAKMIEDSIENTWITSPVLARVQNLNSYLGSNCSENCDEQVIVGGYDSMSAVDNNQDKQAAVLIKDYLIGYNLSPVSGETKKYILTAFVGYETVWMPEVSWRLMLITFSFY